MNKATLLKFNWFPNVPLMVLFCNCLLTHFETTIKKPSIFKWKLMRLNFDQKTFFFFYQGFLSQILTIHRTAKEGREPSLIPLDHFHSLTKIKHLFQTLHVWWLSRIFYCNLVLQIKFFEILDFSHISFKILGLSSQIVSVLRKIWDPRF